jgi:flagellar hook-basal body complex protein FliE
MESNFIKAASAYNNAAAIASPLTKPASGDEDSGGFSDFSGLLTQAMGRARDSIAQGEKMTGKALMKNTNLASVVTAVSEAEIALQTVISLRDKMIGAYQDIIKMPV